jgi:hypothetical protein
MNMKPLEVEFTFEVNWEEIAKSFVFAKRQEIEAERRRRMRDARSQAVGRWLESIWTRPLAAAGGR